ncbi:hypothetical protein AJ80_01341 [Polytolypa hystricis UAMH7299]|uniref:Uncharacterized protein n=1 Tax=Polytolypa hystricis (strain UAMH7299) TaxID=1447883 RepID=A0A2B7Z285_POLH7|nr:hypothetical protein AJ80_01341 [Polytolypa hystricis UAMH7299]
MVFLAASISRRRRESSGSQAWTRSALNRQRVTSSISTGNTSRTSSIQYPVRQPVNAPQGTLAQVDAGFARFLKEHSSPKHQRVTAGGRIVPMNLSGSPAPEFKLPTPASEQSCPMKGDKNRSANKAKSPTSTHSQIESESSMQHHLPYDGGQGNGHAKSFTSTASVAQTSSGRISQRYGETTHPSSMNASGFLSSLESQLPLGLSPNSEILKLGPMSPETAPYGPFYSVAGGVTDAMGLVPAVSQSYYPQFTVSHPLPSPQLPLQAPYVLPSSQLLSMYSAPPTGVMLAPPQLYPNAGGLQNQGIGPFNSPTVPTLPAASQFLDQTTLKSLEDATHEHDMLSDQLANLDRYLALHTWDIDQNTKKHLVEQRKEIVMKLDTVRVSKEQLETSLQQQCKSSILEATQRLEQVGQLGIGSNQMYPYLGTGGGLMSPWAMNVIPNGGMSAGGLNALEGILANSGNPLTSFNSAFHAQAAQGWPIDSDSTTGNYYNVFDDHGMSAPASGEGTNIAQGGKEDRKYHTVQAPEEFARVYNRMEEASKRGDHLDVHIGELATAVAELNLSKPRRSNAIPIQRPKESAKNDTGGDPKKQNTNSREVENSTGKETRMANDTEPSKSVSEPGVQGSWYVPHMEGWEVRILTHMNRQVDAQRGAMPTEVENTQVEDKGKNAASKGTTVKVAASCENKGSATISKTPPRLGCMTQDVNARNPSLGRDGAGSLADSNPSTPIQPVLMSPSKVAEEAPKDSNRHGIFRNNALRFMGWGTSEQKSDSPKVTTSTAAQNINAHGYLPPFDGPGESSGSSGSKPAATANNSGSPRTNGNSTKATDKCPKWSTKSRSEPNPMEVRAFFQRLREEELEMLRRYDGEIRPFG